MLARVSSAATVGIEARLLEVEVDLSPGLPHFTIVGLPDAGVREARERVRSALRNGGFPAPAGAVTVNLAPAGLRKFGASLDLPVAVALLATGGLALPPRPRRLYVGELGLDGSVRPVRGALCLALAALDGAFEEMLVPAANASEAAAVEGLRVIPVRTLAAAVGHLQGSRRISPFRPPLSAAPVADPLDFQEVRGQAVARRALEIAAAGGHHVLLAGPPGAGKTMLARRLPSILPPLSRPEAIEVTRIHSVAGAIREGGGLLERPPFRAPHHGISAAGLVGGGTRPAPGEVSLAHRGVLFLDEFAEFRRDVLEAARQPLEERCVTIVRVGGACVYPCDFLLVAAMNPCPCGYLGDPRRPCSCDYGERLRYTRKLSGPLLDRIDLHVPVPAVPWKDLRPGGPLPEGSPAIRDRVLRARQRAAQRLPELPAPRNADLPAGQLERWLGLDLPARRLLETAVERLQLSVRALHRALRVARTIADLADSERVSGRHLAEAISFRQRLGSGSGPAPPFPNCPTGQVDSPGGRK